jgi:N-sulfoglucosamine sulfohydrolase
LVLFVPCLSASAGAEPQQKRPNILFAIADDQSWAHTRAFAELIERPAYDRVAAMGVVFTNAHCAAPQCSPSRAALLTGRNIWQLEEAGVHGSFFPKKFACYPEVLQNAGYHVGATGKGWSPGDYKTSGRTQNPAGVNWGKKKNKVPAKGISRLDYAANFADFLAEREPGQPFCFWYGAHEPHRGYEFMSGANQGSKDIADVKVPGFLPDNETVRHDILDYAFEIEWFDTHLGRMLDLLEQTGELDNTVVIVTGDNGMPFPRAKANVYEFGTHVPLAICWGKRFKQRPLRQPVSLVSIAPTVLEAAGVEKPETVLAPSLMPLLQGQAVEMPPVFTGRERHTHARFDNWTYPCRAIHTEQYLLIRNFKPERWPAGDPEEYHDIDPSPAKQEVLKRQEFKDLSVGKRPKIELFDLQKDPACLENLAEQQAFAPVRNRLLEQLTLGLTEQGDPRLHGRGDIFESYPRIVGGMRPQLGGFAEKKYNPKYIQPGQQVPPGLMGKEK